MFSTMWHADKYRCINRCRESNLPESLDDFDGYTKSRTERLFISRLLLPWSWSLESFGTCLDFIENVLQLSLKVNYWQKFIQVFSTWIYKSSIIVVVCCPIQLFDHFTKDHDEVCKFFADFWTFLQGWVLYCCLVRPL